ncbi:5'/3'-nucleotidase SurE [Gellertiella hungarica]|uniref:5'-nucleotidase SurE n=1 Tax=Gellertiella hungarica TaxID=1572859 RepID=A0A7W6J556_9HYPH|nr:5'/3'-nucleotidase SurE [Gellertiella hungarica]MBB4064979.1 5'-nucleotidase [Gellertiella hungarica]
MRILLTNDDGIHAEGLAVLERIARQFTDDVWVVAPETDQSGLAHSLTLSEPLRLRKAGPTRFALKGTPTDCVIMGVREVLDSPPDLILSGVNCGSNVADDVTYSGTVAGAIEGTLLGIPSFALSQAYIPNSGRTISWKTTEKFAPEILQQLLDAGPSPGTLVNINFPYCPPDEVKGVAVTRQGKLDHGLVIEERADGRGFPYYWLRFGERRGAFEEGTDIHALRNGKISVTPLKLDLTDYEAQAKIVKALDLGGHA